MAQLEKKYLKVCQYQWKLTGIGSYEQMTILSKMIKFQGVPSFRVGLRNQTFPTLFLITANLNKMGLKAEAVTFSYRDSKEKKMTLFTNDGDGSEIGLQLFTAPLNEYLTWGDRNFANFNFQIYLSGAVETYQLQEVDFLLRNQMSSLMNLVGTDFEIIADGKRFPVHKYMLAARSPVFAAKFKKEKNGAVEEIHWIDAASVNQFINFIYTGQLDGSQLNLEHLMRLALSYEITTLEKLCQAASHTIDLDQMVSFGMKSIPAAAQQIFAMAIT